MSDPARRFRENWLGVVQPSVGLAVSVSVLVDAQCMEKQERATQEALLECTTLDSDGKRFLPSTARVLERVLGLGPELFDTLATSPGPLRLHVPEGKQELRPTLALKRTEDAGQPAKPSADLPAAALAGQGYLALVWEVPESLDLDQPETVTGPWAYPAQAKFDRLLRGGCHQQALVLNERPAVCGQPIGRFRA